MENYQDLSKIGKGSFGTVYKAVNKTNKENVAIKIVSLHPVQRSSREVSLLQSLKHPNIVDCHDVFVDDFCIYIITELLSMDVGHYMENLPQGRYLDKDLVKSYIYQVNQAILFCHTCNVIHRDIKPNNLLITEDGKIKLTDFGLGRRLGTPDDRYTPKVGSMWYMAPEVLLRSKRYTYPVDIWSMGCTFAEMAIRKVLFKGESEINQLNKIFKVLTTPSEDVWITISDHPVTVPKWTTYTLDTEIGDHLCEDGFDLLKKMLVCDPSKRITAKAITEHPYFNNVDLKVTPNLTS